MYCYFMVIQTVYAQGFELQKFLSLQLRLKEAKHFMKRYLAF